MLNHFGVDSSEFCCIFTGSATHALNLVGSNFRWSENSTFAYTLQNHTSVVGVRAYALDAGACVKTCTVEEQQDDDQQAHTLLFSSEQCKVLACASFRSRTQRKDDCVDGSTAPSLFAFPGELEIYVLFSFAIPNSNGCEDGK